MSSDLRDAWRAIWKSPSTSVGAMLALALGIGATTTIFGLLNAVLLRPLPYPEADRLVEIWGTVQRQQVERRGTSVPDYLDWQKQTRSFDGMAAWISSTFIAYGQGDPALVNGELIDGPYLDLLGARTIAGRLFQPEDHKPGAPLVAVLGEKLWEQRFNRGHDAVGKSIQLDSRVYTIVGVVPASFRGRSDTSEVWINLVPSAPGQISNRGSRGFAPIARLAPGVTLAAAQAEMNTVCAQLEKAYPETNEKRYAQVSPLANEIFQTIRPAVSLLFGVVTLVLLIACSNVAGLLLSRGEARRREMSLRRALGADDRRLVRLLLAESAILVVLGGGIGWVVAQWTGDALLALSPVQLPSFAAPATDWRTVIFVSLVAVIVTVTIGLTPLGSFGGGSLAQSLREGAVAARGAGRVSTLRFIVVAEVALAVALLVGAALLGRSFAALLNFDPGFEPQGVLTMRAQFPLPPAPPPAPAPSASPGAPAAPQPQAPPAPPPGVNTFVVLDALRALPGVRHASLTTSVPLVDAGAVFYAAEGMPPADATNRPRIYVQRITTGYFDTLGMKLVEGRDFTPNELVRGNTSVIISENVAKRFWPGQSAIGRRVKQGDLTSQTPWLTIVGVVRETNLRGIPRNPTADPDMYLPFAETTRVFAVVMRADGEPSSVAGTAREALRRINPGVAVFNVRPLAELVDSQLSAAKFLSWVTGSFAVVAFALAIIGIFGTLSYWVRRRTAEIGIRAALGADRSRLLGLVVGQAMTLTAVGVVAGAVLAAVLSRFIQTQLYAVQPIDWISFAGTAAVMLVAALIASVAPAIRALRVNPIIALRSNA
jgi:ABC-type antimicrobial peptide transport system permease subunit